MIRRKSVHLVVVALLVAGCGGSSPEPQLGANPPAGQTIVVATAPTESDLQPGDSVRFVAQVTGTANTSVKWSVDEAGGGTVDATGLYTAPAAEGTYHVRAESVVASSSATAASVKGGGTSVVRVKKVASPAPTPVPVTIAVSPATATLDACRGQVFTASVTNASDDAVTWSIVEAGAGTVTNGAYVAPSTPGTYHVMAVSQADPTKTAQATVTVGAEKVLSVAVTPGSGTVRASGQVPFAATVTTTCGTFAAQ